MYAVIESGGKQYKVTPGKRVRLEKLPAEPGQSIDFDKILLVGDDADCKIGTPYVSGAKVTGTVVEHGRARKIEILKFKRRKHHMKRQGHRQHFTDVEITEIA